MTARTRRYPKVPVTLLLMAMLLALTPTTIAFAELSADDVAATEAPVDQTVQASATEAAGATATQDAVETATESTVTQTEAAATSDGANTSGPYDSTTDGSPSGNGNGNGNGNQPCAGCVGNADDKNPPGQLPGPDDDGDNGYECDGNSGVGKTNPAHSGCKTSDPQDEPDIDLDKTGPSTSTLGATITYDFVVENTGVNRLTNVHITDPLLGVTITVDPSTLEPGEKGVADAEYTVLAKDVVNNKVHNVATVTGTDPDGDEVTDTDPHDVSIPVVVEQRKHTICHATGSATHPYEMIGPALIGVIEGHLGDSHQDGRDIIPPFIGSDGQSHPGQNWDAAGQAIFAAGCVVPSNAAIELEKDGPPASAIGETITYTFEVTNTGDVPLTNVHVTDPLLGGKAIPVTPATLAPKQEGKATARYTVAATDVVDQQVHNTATAHGTPPTGADVVATDDHIVAVPTIIDQPNPAIDLEKSGPPISALGETITYTFEVTNSGDATLTDVHVTDPLLGSAPIAVTPSTLAPKATGKARAKYTVDADDIVNDDELPNTATAHGTPPGGGEVTAVDSHLVQIPVIIVTPQPDIALEKDGPAAARVGERITYTFTVTNTGDVTLTNVRVRDPLLSNRNLAVSPSTLEAGASGTARATYRVTGADGRAGRIFNTAVARGTPPTGPDVSDRDDHTVTVPRIPDAPDPGIRLEKTGPATARVGDTITYRFRATNTGETTLTNVHITDARLGIENLAITPSTLSPGASGTARATYRVTQADADAGLVFNTAIVTGSPPDGPPITDRDDHTTNVPSTPPGPPETPPDTDLPATGSEAAPQLLLAILALLMGAGLLTAARHSRTGFGAWSTSSAYAGSPRLAGADSPPPVHRRR